ncbi:probable aldehyde oxidase 2 [Lolium rigidum]|uniref:probable aldehyde oxidase 2 n=1 Tax=Lolium rigidum TaxID=89674 RepID=UPI001F5D137A|nr:probable aldehyde oxidase 2 [Lolium rigidum]
MVAVWFCSAQQHASEGGTQCAASFHRPNARHHKRLLSSKASGEPPLLLAASVHCAMREAIRAARTEFYADSPLTFQMDVPATMAHVKELCVLDVVERHLHSLSAAAVAPAKA